MEGIHRNLLGSVRQRKYDVVNSIVQATDLTLALALTRHGISL